MKTVVQIKERWDDITALEILKVVLDVCGCAIILLLHYMTYQ